MYEVVVVDDEYSVAEMIAKCIGAVSEFHVARVFRDGADAMEYVANAHTDVLFTDIRMPGLDGIELAGRLLKRNPLCAVVFFSGYSEFEYARKALELGVIDYLTKPVSPLAMRKTLMKIRDVFADQKKRLLGEEDRRLEHECGLFRQLAEEGYRAEDEAEADALLQGRAGYVIRIRPASLKMEGEAFELALLRGSRMLEADMAAWPLFRADDCFYAAAVEKYDALFYIARRCCDTEIEITREAEFDSYRSLAQCPLLPANRGRKASSAEMEAVKHYIQAHLSEDITRDLLAGMLFMSPNYFSTYFQKHEGIGYAEYLRAARMERAKQLLQKSMTVQQICTRVGYSDQKSFLAVFKQYTGMKPSEYRRALLIRAKAGKKEKQNG